MLALDATVVNIALPSAQRELAFADAQRQWVITAYTLSFGGLLLLGGRVADAVGRKRALLVGLAGFTVASALSGAATGLGTLVAARALQGAFAALLAPTALSLLAVTFTRPEDRAKAFAVYGGIAGSGGAVGLVLGGALAQYLDWRWCLYINVPIAAVAAVGCWLTIADSRPAWRPRFDLPGLFLGVGGLMALVYGCGEAASHRLLDAAVAAPIGTAVVLLALFVLRESRADAPLLPLYLLANRGRAGAYLCVLLAIVAMFGLSLVLTYYFQVVLDYSPLQAGAAFLPLSGALLFSSSAIASRLMPHLPPRVLMVPGLLVAGGGMAMLANLQVDSPYAMWVLPAEILLGLGIGCVMVPAISSGTADVPLGDAGVASATMNTAQQIGASLGTALLNTVAAWATTAYLASHAETVVTLGAALVRGYATAAGFAAALLALAAVLAGALITAGKPAVRTSGPSLEARLVQAGR
jgi:EmrB/QacA subfamily drug resistance transporter